MPGSIPSATAIAQASASAAIVVPAIRLLQSFAVWPAPWPPTRTTRRPSSSKSGRARSNALGLTADHDRQRRVGSAPRGPPLTGASRTSEAGTLGGEPSREGGRARREVDEERSRVGRLRGRRRGPAPHPSTAAGEGSERSTASRRGSDVGRRLAHALRRAPRPASGRGRSRRARGPRREGVAPSAGPSSRGRSRRPGSSPLRRSSLPNAPSRACGRPLDATATQITSSSGARRVRDPHLERLVVRAHACGRPCA